LEGIKPEIMEKLRRKPTDMLEKVKKLRNVKKVEKPEEV